MHARGPPQQPLLGQLGRLRGKSTSSMQGLHRLTPSVSAYNTMQTLTRTKVRHQRHEP
jgi:hypothetical protein